ncbi:MAG TPA: radical SAM family heme chaperone HemW [Nitrosomonas sp.]|nr:radical SAM family heme chaperone HemW [Nitrosomonas sp.]HQX13762.1 radical SAM family heme chaperone HemW [Nitrosomonas sp.]HRB20953.1 radical SAM family heme chaperone HemW [Nitrosomonas sp.]HRB32441.1 radical SAM family heme chaperone HemW [Nitrosomonas sp.]HRB45280.1 radical SAM family heme chaperone HemW [Nitrosomonas sp.]
MNDLVSKLAALPPLSLYIHIPWCLKKCPYCDFNSHEVRKNGDEQTQIEKNYVAALIRDLEMALADVWGRRLNSVFFGGGTPSLFSASSIDAILTAVRTLMPLEHFAEVTLEANPGTFEAQKFADYRAAGINRLSIGIQSFNPKMLKAIGRVHDDQDALHAVHIAQNNFANINLDLMYALPGQTLDEAKSDIATACSFGVSHLSAYHLTLEPNTLFHRFPPTLPDDEQAAAMQDMIEQTASLYGYQHYETSAFAQQGKLSQHNLNYWLFGDYLGIGAGAHSKISFADKIIRQMRYKQPKEYLLQNQSGATLIQTQQILSNADRAFEFMMNALRLNDGFDSKLFEERTGLPLNVIQTQLDQAEERGLLVRNAFRIKPTILGKRFLNDLLQIFLPETSKILLS